MRKYSILALTAGIILAFGSTGCSVFRSSSSSGGSGKGIQGWFESGKDKVDDTAKDAGKDMPDDSNKSNDNASEKSDDVSVRDVSLAGDWAVETVLGKKAVGEIPPFIKFVPGENRIYGNNGCNTINGGFDVNYSKKSLSFSNLATTMMLCATSGITDVEIGQAVGQTVGFRIKSDDYDSILSLLNAEGAVVMELLHRDFHFLDGTWAVTSIDGEKVNVEGMKIALDVEERRIHGNTGCNIINGELETDMDTANSISFSKIAMTRMACPDSGWETRMMMALEEAVTARKIGDDGIELIGSNGKQVMVLKKTSPIDD